MLYIDLLLSKFGLYQTLNSEDNAREACMGSWFLDVRFTLYLSTLSHTNKDDSKKPFSYLLIIDMSIWSLHDGTNRCATLVTKPPDVTLCHSSGTAARSPAVFLGNGFIPLMRLDIYDHMLSIILLSGPFVDPRRTSIAALARNPSLILAWSQLYLPMYNYQCVAHYEAWRCDQYISVQLGLRNIN